MGKREPKRARRFVIGALAVVGVLVALAAAVPLVISPAVVKSRIVDQIAYWTGREFTFRGEPQISLYPYLTVRLNDAKLSNPEGMGDEPFIAVDTMTAKLEILPLFLGRLEFARFRLSNPRINLRTDADGRGNWIMAEGVIGSQMSKGDKEGATDEVDPPSPLADVRLGRMAIRDGIISYTDGRTGRKEELSKVVASFDWTRTSQMAAGDGSFIWRGEPVEFNGSVDAPLDLLAGGSSSLRFGFSATPLRLSFAGSALQLDGTQLEGDIKLTTPSVRRVVEWLGSPMGTGAILGAGAIDGRINWIGPSVSIADATFELDGNAAEGALSVAVGEDAFGVSGTLAFDSLDLSPYVEAAHAGLTSAGAWQLVPAQLPLDAVGAVDLRLSTSQLIAGNAEIGRTGATVTLKNGELVINVGEAELEEGTADGRLALVMDGDALTAAGQVRVQDVLVAEMLGQLADIDALTGVGTATVDAKARGVTWGDVFETLAGTARVAIDNGVLKGIDLAALPEAVRAPGEFAFTGSTAFVAAGATLAFGDGVVATDDLHADGDDYSLRLTGRAGLLDPTIEARGTLTLVDPENGGAASDVPFRIGGTWDDWSVAPDLGPPVERDMTPADEPVVPGDG